MKIELEKFEKMVDLISCSSIAESGTILGSTFHRNIEYALTSAIWRGPDLMNAVLQGFEICPLVGYSGELEPLEYNEHYLDVCANGRERGYGGMLVKHRGKDVVFIGEQIEFTATEKRVEQLTLF